MTHDGTEKKIPSHTGDRVVEMTFNGSVLYNILHQTMDGTS